MHTNRQQTTAVQSRTKTPDAKNSGKQDSINPNVKTDRSASKHIPKEISQKTNTKKSTQPKKTSCTNVIRDKSPANSTVPNTSREDGIKNTIKSKIPRKQNSIGRNIGSSSTISINKSIDLIDTNQIFTNSLNSKQKLSQVNNQSTNKLESIEGVQKRAINQEDKKVPAHKATVVRYATFGRDESADDNQTEMIQEKEAKKLEKKKKN